VPESEYIAAMGEPYKKDKGWAFRADLGPDPATGERRQVLRQGFATKRAATAAQTELLAGVLNGQVVTRSSATVRDYLEGWLDVQGAHIRPTSLHGYRMAVQRITAKVGSAKLQSLTVLSLDQLYAGMLADGLAPKTIKNTHGVLRRALDDAVRTGLLLANPAATARTPSVRRPEFGIWTADQVREFLSATADDRLNALWAVLAMTGMRRGEALGLRWQDIEVGKRRINIVQTRTTAGQLEVIGDTKTERSRRRLLIDDGTAAALRAFKKLAAAEQLAAGEVYDTTSDLVFKDELGRPIKVDRVSRAFKAAAKAADLPEIRLHDLRHSWATRAMEAGVPSRVVADHLGHSTTNITENLYQHVRESSAREAVEKVAAGIYD
jgi:integrase